MPTILAVNGNLAEIASRLLAAAGNAPDRVQIVTGGKYPGVSVDDELARAAGYVRDEDQADAEGAGGSTAVVSAEAPENPESNPAKPAPEPKKAPAKRTSSRTTK
ncbi:hypothetical protein [Nocardia abscessus]|uniref:hypothetical protein n=1 Tax=Nocardia abscessus TaxID=120957 RepID=UPI0024582653|nr:hypothetical protein [Nocardia abscessus]